MVFLKQSFDHNFFLIKFGQNLSVGSLLPLGQVPAPTGLLRTLAGLPLSLTPGASVQSLLLGEASPADCTASSGLPELILHTHW